MDQGDTDQPGEPSTSPPTRYSSKEPMHSHLQQDRHHGLGHRCKGLYLAQHPQPRVKFSPSSDAALLEYGGGGTPAAQTHLLLPEYGGEQNDLQAQEQATRSKSGTPRTLDIGSPHRSASKTRGQREGDVDECPGLQIHCFEAPMGHGNTAGTVLSAGRGKLFPSRIFPFCIAYLNTHYFCRPCIQVSRIWPTGSTADL